MKIIPIGLKQANEFIKLHHRHNGKIQGCKFCIGAIDDNNNLIGVAIVGRPVSRHLDTGDTAEVTRLCTNETKNACSFIYSACMRIAKEMGFKRIQTYILESENGASLKASNWILAEGLRGGGNWNVPSRKRKNSPNLCKKQLYYKNLK